MLTRKTLIIVDPGKNFILSHIDDTLLKTMSDINQDLLQFIDVMNLVDLLLHFSPSVSSVTQVINGANVPVYDKKF